MPPLSFTARSLPATQHLGPMRQRIRPGGLAANPQPWFVGPAPAVGCRPRNTKNDASDKVDADPGFLQSAGGGSIRRSMRHRSRLPQPVTRSTSRPTW